MPRSIQTLFLPETAHLPAYRHHHTKCRKLRTWETNLSVCPKQCHQNGHILEKSSSLPQPIKDSFSPLETQDNPFAAKFFWIVCRTVSTVYPYCWICSLPTDWEPSSRCIPTLSVLFSQKGRGRRHSLLRCFRTALPPCGSNIGSLCFWSVQVVFIAPPVSVPGYRKTSPHKVFRGYFPLILNPQEKSLTQ